MTNGTKFIISVFVVIIIGLSAYVTLQKQDNNIAKENIKVSSGGNLVVKKFGGKSEISLPPNTKFQLITWKDNNLWVLYRPVRHGEIFPETYVYQESSLFNVIEGTITIKETRE